MIRILFTATMLLSCVACSSPPVMIEFPDFPEAVAAIDLGEKITIEVRTANDGPADDKAAGVTWTCEGPACTALQVNAKSVTFNASGLAGKATLTAKSVRQPSVTKSLRITVNLNDTPDLLCFAKRPAAVVS